jgi:ribonuclease D
VITCVMAGVVSGHEIESIAAHVAHAPLVAFDLEFATADRLIPVLCLVQVAWVHPGSDAGDGPFDAGVHVALLDPLADDVGPVVRALAAHPHVVAHAPRQDLQILAQRFGVVLPGAVDTQVMAAFAGMGDQLGLAALVRELLGLSLTKEQQWTDWTVRPLSDAQLRYAAADVRYLPELYRQLAARLGPRLAWARAETAEIARDAEAAARITPETAWRQLDVHRLDAPTAAAVAAIAAWRLRVATELDKPLGWVMTDKQIIELARTSADAPNGIARIRGVPGVARQRGDELVALIAAAQRGPGPDLPAVVVHPATPRAQRWAELLLVIAQVRADELGVSVRLLATRADAETVARAVDGGGMAAAAGLRPFQTWRRTAIGDLWEGWLQGTRSLACDPASPAGFALRPV